MPQSGSLVRVDWGERRVVRRIPIVAGHPVETDLNPRGGSRGGRGIVRVGPHLVVASFNSLLRFTADLEPVDGATHGLLAGIHQLDVAPGSDAIWAAATSIDAALLVRLGTGELLDERWPRESPGLQTALGLWPLAIDKSADQRSMSSERSLRDRGHVHLNAVRLHEGRLLGLLNRRGAIVDLDTGRVIVQHRSLVGSHDLLPASDGTVIVNDTVGARVRTFDLATGRLTRTFDLRQSPWVRQLEASVHPRPRLMRAVGRALSRPVVTRPLFVRGLARHEDHLYVGVSPAAILELDESTGALVSAYQYSSDANECVHGLYVWS